MERKKSSKLEGLSMTLDMIRDHKKLKRENPGIDIEKIPVTAYVASGLIDLGFLAIGGVLTYGAYKIYTSL